jgi:SSS family solute:Na+ symporter
MAWFALCVYSWATSQAYLQRAFACKDEKIARFAYLFCAVNYTVFAIAVCGIGLATSVLIPHLIDPQQAFPALIEMVLPRELRTFFLLGVVAAALAASSTFLTSSASIVVQDLIPSMGIFKRWQKTTLQNPIAASRWIILLLAGLSLITALNFKGIINLVIFSAIVGPAALFAPLLLALYWKNSKGAGGFWAVLGGALSGVLAQTVFFEKTEGWLGAIHPLFLGPALGFLILVGANLGSVALVEQKKLQ